MFEKFKRALNVSKEMWNSSGYWAEVVIEYQKLTGWNLERISNVSDGPELLDAFCKNAMKSGVSAKDCATAIYENGYANPDVLNQSRSEEIEEEKEEEEGKGGPFDARNPELAVVFHQFKDEVADKRGYSIAQANHPQFREVIEADYDKYRGELVERGDTPERLLDRMVSDYVGILLSTERKLTNSPDQYRAGTSVALVVILRALFGGGPRYASSILADAQVTTLCLLEKVLSDYRDRYPERSTTDFGKGASWAIAEFQRRCQSAYALSSLAITQQAQLNLIEEFSRNGLEILCLHPVIQRALLDEAIVFGRIQRTVEMFFETAALVQKKTASDDEKAQMLVAVWKARGEMYRKAENQR